MNFESPQERNGGDDPESEVSKESDPRNRREKALDLLRDFQKKYSDISDEGWKKEEPQLIESIRELGEGQYAREGGQYILDLYHNIFGQHPSLWPNLYEEFIDQRVRKMPYGSNVKETMPINSKMVARGTHNRNKYQGYFSDKVNENRIKRTINPEFSDEDLRFKEWYHKNLKAVFMIPISGIGSGIVIKSELESFKNFVKDVQDKIGMGDLVSKINIPNFYFLPEAGKGDFSKGVFTHKIAFDCIQKIISNGKDLSDTSEQTEIPEAKELGLSGLDVEILRGLLKSIHNISAQIERSDLQDGDELMLLDEGFSSGGTMDGAIDLIKLGLRALHNRKNDFSVDKIKIIEYFDRVGIQNSPFIKMIERKDDGEGNVIVRRKIERGHHQSSPAMFQSDKSDIETMKKIGKARFDRYSHNLNVMARKFAYYFSDINPSYEFWYELLKKSA